MNRNLEELEAHSGEYFEHWRSRLRKAVNPLDGIVAALERRIAELELELSRERERTG